MTAHPVPFAKPRFALNAALRNRSYFLIARTGLTERFLLLYPEKDTESSQTAGERLWPKEAEGEDCMKKKKAAIIWLLAAVLLAAGCSGGFDASMYVRGALNNIYLGDPTEYMELVDITEEEAAEEYEQGIEVEADYFLQYYGIGEVSDEVYQQIVDMYKTIYQQSRFEVQEAVRNGDDYNVEVLISPIDVIVNSEEDISAAVDEFVASVDPADYPDDLSINDALAQLVVDVINENMPELGWLDQKSVIVKVEKDEAGYYGLSSDAISQLDQDIIAY